MSRDYYAELKKQLDFIKTSCREYDAGNFFEAIRIATHLRTIFHKSNNPKTKPIILKLPVDLMLSTSFPYNDKNLLGFSGLASMKISGGVQAKAEYVPMLSKTLTRRLISVEAWWEQEVIYAYKPGETMVRKRLVRIAADQDGGAHVDDKLPQEYETMIAGGAWSAKAQIDGREIPFENAHLAALRQMGYEVLNTPQIMNLIA